MDFTVDSMTLLPDDTFGSPPPLPEVPGGGGGPGATGGRRRNAGAGGGAGGGEGQPQQCPPGQVLINGRCRHPGDFPCPEGQCKDVVTGQCRTPGRNEKANETDDFERASGGGRGFCRQRDAGRRAGAGGGASLQDEQAYFDRLVSQGDWTGVGGGWFYNDPGNDRSRRVWVNRNNLRLDSTGQGYQSISDAQYQQMGSPGGPSPAGGPGGTFPPSGAPNLASQIEQTLSQILSGGQTRFSPEVMADITAGAKAQQQAEVASGTEQLNEDLASRGLAFSPAGASLAQGVRSQAAGRFDTTMRDTRQKKAMFDFEDKMTALTTAQRYIDSARQYALGLDSNSIQRQQIEASLTIARENIAAQAQNLAAQLASQRDLMGMQIGSQEFMFMQSQMRCLMNPAAC